MKNDFVNLVAKTWLEENALTLIMMEEDQVSTFVTFMAVPNYTYSSDEAEIITQVVRRLDPDDQVDKLCLILKASPNILSNQLMVVQPKLTKEKAKIIAKEPGL